MLSFYTARAPKSAIDCTGSSPPGRPFQEPRAGTRRTRAPTFLSGLSSPIAADRAAEGYPSQRKVSHFGYGRIHRHDLFQVNDATICRVTCRSTQELPPPIIGIMGGHHDRRPRKDRSSRDDAKARILVESKAAAHLAPFSRLQSRHSSCPLSGVPEPPFDRGST